MKLLSLFVLYAIALSISLARRGYRSRRVPGSDTPHPRPTRILIVGATGGTGRELVAQALERGFMVTALVRNPAALKINHPNLTVKQGDVLDSASIEAAVQGQDAVVSALGHKRFFYPTRILSQGTSHLLRAMEKFGVSRLVCASSLGLGDSAGRMGLYFTLFTLPVALPFYFWDKARMERVVAESSLDWVIVRPGVLTHAPKRDHVRHGPNVGHYVLPVHVSRALVADFMLNQLTTDQYLHSAPGLAG
jgi:putative NADH-flavin reductase